MHKIFANTLFIGKQVVYLPSCHSTNDLMAQMSAKNQLHEGAIVITKHQTKGKGQRGNTWQSPIGENLTFSLFLKPKFLKSAQQFELNRIVSLSVLDVLKKLIPNRKSFIKWPNDLILNKKKIAGILIENSINRNGISESIIGIGLNVNQTESVLPTATTMALSTNTDWNLNLVLEEILHSIEHYFLILRSGNFKLIHELYELNLYLKDRVAFYEDSVGKFNGIIRKVNADGALEIEDEGGVHKKYQFKEVRLLSND